MIYRDIECLNYLKKIEVKGRYEDIRRSLVELREDIGVNLHIERVTNEYAIVSKEITTFKTAADFIRAKLDTLSDIHDNVFISVFDFENINLEAADQSEIKSVIAKIRVVLSAIGAMIYTSADLEKKGILIMPKDFIYGHCYTKLNKKQMQELHVTITENNKPNYIENKNIMSDELEEIVLLLSEMRLNMVRIEQLLDIKREDIKTPIISKIKKLAKENEGITIRMIKNKLRPMPAYEVESLIKSLVQNRTLITKEIKIRGQNTIKYITAL